jgi:hypothetical protein
LQGVRALIEASDPFAAESIRKHLSVPLPAPRCYDAFYLNVPKYECAAEFHDKKTESSLKVFRSSLKENAPIVFGTLEYALPKRAHPTLTRTQAVLGLDFKSRFDEMIDFSWGKQAKTEHAFTAITWNFGKPLIVNLYVLDGRVRRLSLTRNDDAR